MMIRDEDKTKEQLIAELAILRQRNHELAVAAKQTHPHKEQHSFSANRGTYQDSETSWMGWGDVNLEQAAEIRQLNDELEHRVIQRTVQLQASNLKLKAEIVERCRAEAESQRLFNQLEKGLSQLEAVVNSMTEGLITSDPDGNIVAINPVALRLHGYENSLECRKNLEDFVNVIEMRHLDGRSLLFDEWPLRRALRGETFSGYEIHVRRRDLGREWIGSYGGTAVRDKHGEIILAIVTIRDVTADKQAQEELARSLEREQAARAQAESANRIKDEFLAVLSHEMRSPLNPILGWTRLLRTRHLDAETTATALETIERNAKLQAQLIEDLLDVSCILRGRLALDIRPVNLATTIKASLETVQLSAIAKSIQIKTVLASDVGDIQGDCSRIQQVIWNLLSNAVKFTPEGGRVEVRLECVDGGDGEGRGDGGDGGDGEVLSSSSLPSLPPSSSLPPSPPLPPSSSFHYAQITVKDTGKGISSKFLPHVFDYFRQADSSTTRAFGGLGLGLAIVKHIVELHHGTVSAYSEGEGHGAIFTVRLPIQVAASDQPQPQEHSNSSFILHPSSLLHGLRVLVVDDDPDTRSFLSYMLNGCGATVMTAASAEEALRSLSHPFPNILISDIGMPKMNGYELIRQIRSRYPQESERVWAIALTAYAGEQNQQQAITAGFHQHISKPVEPEQLIQAITALVNREPVS